MVNPVVIGATGVALPSKIGKPALTGRKHCFGCCQGEFFIKQKGKETGSALLLLYSDYGSDTVAGIFNSTNCFAEFPGIFASYYGNLLLN